MYTRAEANKIPATTQPLSISFRFRCSTIPWRACGINTIQIVLANMKFQLFFCCSLVWFRVFFPHQPTHFFILYTFVSVYVFFSFSLYGFRGWYFLLIMLPKVVIAIAKKTAHGIAIWSLKLIRSMLLYQHTSTDIMKNSNKKWERDKESDVVRKRYSTKLQIISRGNRAF